MISLASPGVTASSRASTTTVNRRRPDRSGRPGLPGTTSSSRSGSAADAARASSGQAQLGQLPQVAFSWVNRSAAAVPTAAMSVPTVCRFLVTSPLPRSPTAVSRLCIDVCMALTCGL
jgi:hypothetical protein